jgi:hypothetical protein
MYTCSFFETRSEKHIVVISAPELLGVEALFQKSAWQFTKFGTAGYFPWHCDLDCYRSELKCGAKQGFTLPTSG